jgi:MFS family permease
MSDSSASASDDAEQTGERTSSSGATIAGVDIGAAIGGRRGLVDSGLPSLVFVGVYTLGGQELRPALIAALVTAGLLTAWRLIRRQPLTQAFAGFAGVAIASFIASRTGEARNYFLTGFLTNGAYLVACVVSIAVRWPLVGVVLGPLLGEGMTWRRHHERFVVYRQMTWVFAGLFAIRLLVQGYLYWQDDVLWLGIARFAMGLPLYLSAVGLAYWMIRRAPPPRTDAESDESTQE